LFDINVSSRGRYAWFHPFLRNNLLKLFLLRYNLFLRKNWDSRGLVGLKGGLEDLLCSFSAGKPVAGGLKAFSVFLGNILSVISSF
jgi:hypothetical protein